jgi:hypothetical protein
MSALNELIGLSITKASRVLDYAQLDFGDAATLSIMNDFALSGVRGLEGLMGRTLRGVTESEQDISLLFDADVRLTVSLSENAYHCPEAMTLHQEGKPVCVWN